MSRVASNSSIQLSASVAGLVLLLGLCLLAVHAQSGRRTPKPAASPTPEASPESKPSPKPKTDDKDKVGLILGIDGNSFNNIPLYYYDAVLSSCADRLNDAPSISLDVSGRDMNRAEAIKIAKAQKEAFVAALELRSDTMSAQTNSNYYANIYIEFVVFAPQTAKIVTSGHAYQRALRSGPVIMQPPTTGRTSTVYTEQVLRQAARDAADQILDGLHVLARQRRGP